MREFEPQILAFCCHYCAYAAADLAGTFRAQYPTNVRIIRVPCSGKVDPMHILQAFESGADGVLVAGCLEGGCHFQEGNLRAKRRVGLLQKMLDEVGIESDRLRMVNLSSAMGQTFANMVTEFTEQIRQLGPSPVTNNAAGKGTRRQDECAARNLQARRLRYEESADETPALPESQEGN